ncbi:MAG: hypothetical protein JWN24_3437 [Phycisphaerales bacterium]|nr:hypothetical protein [Phycisphaerales bacterium]
MLQILHVLTQGVIGSLTPLLARRLLNAITATFQGRSFAPTGAQLLAQARVFPLPLHIRQKLGAQRIGPPIELNMR